MEQPQETRKQYHKMMEMPIPKLVASLEMCIRDRNYTNPMAMLSGFMQRYTGVKTVGLCHSVQVCSETLLNALGMEDRLEGRKELIAGINHMGWLLEIRDRNGNDLYPEIRRRALEKNAGEKHADMVRFEYIRRLGYYCTCLLYTSPLST